MASYRAGRQVLSLDPRIKQFLIANVQATGKKLGSGAYGSVEELEIDGVFCAGKRIHEALLEEGNAHVQSLVVKYVEECQLLSNLRHPHIVQFIGLCFLPDSSLPLLIMELLLTNLDDLVENTPDIPLSLKISMLADVAKGLTYLHNRTPPIIHRDLSAKNVLLNSAMVAKISDLGNSRIVTVEPLQLAKSLTRVPGTIVYMPPEAFEGTCPYSQKLDVFSFGHLALFTLIQVFPQNLLAPTYKNPHNQKQLIARSEVERREKYVDQLHQQLGEQHPMVQLVKQCLENDPEDRPPASIILQRLEGMGITDEYQHLTKVEMMKRLKQKDEENQSLQSQLQHIQLSKDHIPMEPHVQPHIGHSDSDAEVALQMVTDLQSRNQVLETQILRINTDIRALQEQVHQKNAILCEKDALLHQKEDELALLRSQGKTKTPPKSKAQQMTALMIAAQKGHLDVMNKLIKNGANIHMETENGFTPLHYACQFGQPTAVSLLLRHGANLHLTTKKAYGATPLMLACIFGHVAVVQVLIEAKADVNQWSRTQQKTALMIAAERGHLEVLNLLIQNGADVNRKDKAGNTAADLAHQKGHGEVYQAFPDQQSKFGTWRRLFSK